MLFTLGSYKNIMTHSYFWRNYFREGKIFLQNGHKDYFRACNRWLDKFKKQFVKCFPTITGEKLSYVVSAVDPFVRKLQERTEDLGLRLEQVYNTD
jgi:hypothetical protein